MQEVKKPSRRPLICYYLAALLILMLLNMTFFPAVLEKPVQDVTYDQFMSMTYDKNVGQVEIEGDEITFTDKAAENIYAPPSQTTPAGRTACLKAGPSSRRSIPSPACSPPSWWGGCSPCCPSC